MKKLLLIVLLAVQGMAAQSTSVSSTTSDNTVTFDNPTFNFECPDPRQEELSLIHAEFVADAASRGVDVSGASGVYIFENQPREGWIAQTGSYCWNDLYIISINEGHLTYPWDSLTYEQKRFVIFHELGHDLFAYNHNCRAFARNVPVGATTYFGRYYTDIMHAGDACPDTGFGRGLEYTDDVYTWSNLVSRLVSGTQQVRIDLDSIPVGGGGTLPCSAFRRPDIPNTGKGVVIELPPIYD